MSSLDNMPREVQDRIIYHVEAFKKLEEDSEDRRFLEKYKDYKPVVIKDSEQ